MRRSEAIVRGLVVTGRAAEAVADGDWLKAQARRSRRVLLDLGDCRWPAQRGVDVSSASELGRAFASAMRDRGATKV